MGGREVGREVGSRDGHIRLNGYLKIDENSLNIS